MKNAFTVIGIVAILATGLLLPGLSASAQVEDVDLSIGNAEGGKATYDLVCVACHGDQAQGNAQLNAPKLAGQEPWYIARQLKNFKEGVRGSDQRDLFGMQMRPMALTLKGDQDIANIVAYISTLDK